MHYPHLCLIAVGCETIDFNAEHFGLTFLIINQRNQWQHTKINSLDHKSESLKCQTLASSSWHTHKNIMILETAFDDCFLIKFELFYLWELAQHVVEFVISFFVLSLPLLVACQVIVQTIWESILAEYLSNCLGRSIFCQQRRLIVSIHLWGVFIPFYRFFILFWQRISERER